MMENRELQRRRAQAESLRGYREQREFTVSGMECRALDDGMMRMSGYASLTEHPYKIGSGDRGFTEVIRKGAFTRTLSESPDVVLLANHDGLPLAGTRNGSLALMEDARGLHWSADLDAADDDSRALARRVESGLLDQCSFAFITTDQKWSDDFKHREIKSLSLHRGDVSVVTHGANAATSVGLRSDTTSHRRMIVIPDHTSRARQQLEALQADVDRPRRTRRRPVVGKSAPVDYRRELRELRERPR